MSLGKVAVSFTHTIKAMEPFFSVVLSAMFLGEVCFVSSIYYLQCSIFYANEFTYTEYGFSLLPLFAMNTNYPTLQMPTPWVVGSLLPIAGGVALASMTEASFNW